MPKSTFPAAAIGSPVDGPNRPKVSNMHRHAIMQAAHRARRALGVSMSDALRQAWAAFRKARMCRRPLDHLIIPHEREALRSPARLDPAYQTRDSLRLSRLFAI
jgi:hypothetical protein